MNIDQKENEIENTQVPLFGSWKRWYFFLLGFLVIQILMYTWLTYKYL